jgi:hypothetical protein
MQSSPESFLAPAWAVQKPRFWGQFPIGDKTARMIKPSYPS